MFHTYLTTTPAPVPLVQLLPVQGHRENDLPELHVQGGGELLPPKDLVSQSLQPAPAAATSRGGRSLILCPTLMRTGLASRYPLACRPQHSVCTTLLGGERPLSVVAETCDWTGPCHLAKK